MGKIKKFDELFEYKTFLTEQELLEMANVTDETTGIKNVVIWIGPPPTMHGHRIKISNIPNKFDGSDCFVMTIPEFDIIGNVNKSFIKTETIEKIKEFVLLNMDLIIDYSNYKTSTKELLDNLKSV